MLSERHGRPSPSPRGPSDSPREYSFKCISVDYHCPFGKGRKYLPFPPMQLQKVKLDKILGIGNMCLWIGEQWSQRFGGHQKGEGFNSVQNRLSREVTSSPHCFLECRGPGPAPDPLSENLGQVWEGGQPVQLTRASRPEGGLGPDCCRLIQILGKDLQPFCPCWGAQTLGLCSGPPAFPDDANLVQLGIDQREARQGEGTGHSSKLFASPNCGGNSRLGF